MIDLKGYKGFAIIKSDMSVEANKLRLYYFINNSGVIL